MFSVEHREQSNLSDLSPFASWPTAEQLDYFRVFHLAILKERVGRDEASQHVVGYKSKGANALTQHLDNAGFLAFVFYP